MKYRKIGKWLFFSVLLSFFPIYVNGFLSIVDNFYRWNWEGFITDMFITIALFSLTVCADTLEYECAGWRVLLKGVITVTTCLIFLFTLLLYGWSLNAKEGQMNLQFLLLFVAGTSTATIVFGLLSQVFLEDGTSNKH